MKNPLRHSLHVLSDLAARAPRFDGIVSTAGQRRRRRTKRVAREAGWLGAGLVLGAGLTSLFTPNTGAEVRKRLSDQGMRLREFIASKTKSAAPFGPAAKRSSRDDRTRKSKEGEEGGFDAHP
jgi:hypothetical protein